MSTTLIRPSVARSLDLVTRYAEAAREAALVTPDECDGLPLDRTTCTDRAAHM